MSEEEFETVSDALTAFKQGRVSEEQIKAQFGDVDGVERSIAVAQAKRVNTKSREDVADVVTSGVVLSEQQ